MVYESAITASCSDTNYSVTWTDGKQSADYTVNTRDISITIDSVEKIYGENDPALAFTFDATELQYSDNVNALGVTLTRASGDNVGNYAISGTSSSANYAVTFTNSGEKLFTINKREITVTLKQSRLRK